MGGSEVLGDPQVTIGFNTKSWSNDLDDLRAPSILGNLRICTEDSRLHWLWWLANTRSNSSAASCWNRICQVQRPILQVNITCASFSLVFLLNRPDQIYQISKLSKNAGPQFHCSPWDYSRFAPQIFPVPWARAHRCHRLEAPHQPSTLDPDATIDGFSMGFSHDLWGVSHDLWWILHGKTHGIFDVQNSWGGFPAFGWSLGWAVPIVVPRAPLCHAMTWGRELNVDLDIGLELDRYRLKFGYIKIDLDRFRYIQI